MALFGRDRVQGNISMVTAGGHFRCSYKRERAYVIAAAAMAVCWLLGGIITAHPLLGEFKLSTVRGVFTLIQLSAELPLFIALFFILRGRGYSYNADEEKFTVTLPGGRRDIFFYSDVSSVRFEDRWLFRVLRGYTVTITAGSREVSYQYIRRRNENIESRADTPFNCLYINSELARKKLTQ